MKKKIRIVIFVLIFCMFYFNNKAYSFLDKSLSYNTDDYIIKYDAEFNRIKLDIEVNDLKTNKCKLSINQEEVKEIEVTGGHCFYYFNNLEENTEYNIKIEFYEDTKLINTFNEKVKTLTNFTNYLMNLKHESLAEVGMYHHTDSLKSGAKDDSYRYSGKDVNNWVCLSEDDKCNNNDLYRIIGVFKDKKNDYHIKLIAYDYVSEEYLGSDGNRNKTGFEFSPNKYYLGDNDKIHTYFWYNSAELYHNWNESLLNKTNLNNNFYNYLDEYKGIAYPEDWIYVGEDFNIEETAATIFQNEIKKSKNVYKDEIGLMYVSDYLFANNPKYWDKKGDEVNQDNWLYLGANEWTITKGKENKIICIKENGKLSYHDNNLAYAVRPTFYLRSNVVLEDGDGSRENPFRISLTLGQDNYFISSGTNTFLINDEDILSIRAENNLPLSNEEINSDAVNIDFTVTGSLPQSANPVTYKVYAIEGTAPTEPANPQGDTSRTWKPFKDSEISLGLSVTGATDSAVTITDGYKTDLTSEAKTYGKAIGKLEDVDTGDGTKGLLLATGTLKAGESIDHKFTIHMWINSTVTISDTDYSKTYRASSTEKGDSPLPYDETLDADNSKNLTQDKEEDDREVYSDHYYSIKLKVVASDDPAFNG